MNPNIIPVLFLVLCIGFLIGAMVTRWWMER